MSLSRVSYFVSAEKKCLRSSVPSPIPTPTPFAWILRPSKLVHVGIDSFQNDANIADTATAIVKVTKGLQEKMRND
jgi:hypothetical protein